MIRDIVYRLRAILDRNSVERDLDEELQAHLDRETEKLVARGLPPDEALRRARVALGGLDQVKEDCRDARGVQVIDDLRMDLRYAARTFARSPALALTATLSIGLGIGANTAIFSLVNTLLLRTLPVDRPAELERLTVRDALILSGSAAFSRGVESHFSFPLFREFRQRNQVFSGLLARMLVPASLVSVGFAEHVPIELVSGNYFDVLGVRPVLGRTISEADDRVPLGHPVAVISFRYWQEKLAADTAITGKIIRIDNHPYTVIGVGPPGFYGVEVGARPDVWVPLMMQPELFGFTRPMFETNRWAPLEIIGRRARGVTEAQAQAALDVIYRRFQEKELHRTAGEMSRETICLEPGGTGLSQLRSDFKNPLAVLMVVVTLVLLIAIANVANLLLARSATRRKEVAVRLALGAGRGRLIRQLLTESALLGLLGGVMGIAFAGWGIRLLLMFLPAVRPQYGLNFAFDDSLDARVLGFGLSISIVSGLLFGLAPALQSACTDLAESIRREVGVFRIVSRRFGLGNALVVLQVTLSLVLLVGAGLFLRSLQNTSAIRLGMDTQNVLMASIDTRLSGYSPVQANRFFRELEARLREKAGVRAVGSSQVALLSGGWDTFPVVVPERPRPPGQRQALLNVIGGDFMRAAGITILRGRGFDVTDAASSTQVAILSETAARYFFGGEEPIGRAINAERMTAIKIIGLASDSKYASVREDNPRVLYLSVEQIPKIADARTLYLRTSGDPHQLAAVLQKEVRELDENVPVYNIKTFAEQKADSLARERLIATLSIMFGMLALLLAAIGLYGVISYGVVRQTHEIGIRTALGADRTTVVWMVLHNAMGMVMIGMLTGIALSWWLSGLVISLLYGVKPGDPATFATACVVLTAAALVAAGIPAWKASRVSPLTALRYE
jgi:predicted permease